NPGDIFLPPRSPVSVPPGGRSAVRVVITTYATTRWERVAIVKGWHGLNELIVERKQDLLSHFFEHVVCNRTQVFIESLERRLKIRAVLIHHVILEQQIDLR